MFKVALDREDLGSFPTISKLFLHKLTFYILFGVNAPEKIGEINATLFYATYGD